MLKDLGSFPVLAIMKEIICTERKEICRKRDQGSQTGMRMIGRLWPDTSQFL
jgi:hypothetical protein